MWVLTYKVRINYNKIYSRCHWISERWTIGRNGFIADDEPWTLTSTFLIEWIVIGLCFDKLSTPPLLPYIALISVFYPQMALPGFHYDSSLFTSHMTSIYARAQDDNHCAGVPERIGALKSLVVPGLKSRSPARQVGAISIELCPSGCFDQLNSSINASTVILL